MADHYLGLIREVQPRGPYLLGGASMGGMVAYEMARQLEMAGERVALLTLMDTPCLDQMPEREGHAEAVAAALPFALPVPLERLRAIAPADQLDFAVERARRAGSLPESFDAEQTRRHVAVIMANVAALYGHQPRPYCGRMLYFRARHRRPGDPPRPELPWIELVEGGVEVVRVPGDHMTMHEAPNLEAMVAHLKWALDLCRQPRWLATPRRPQAGAAERAETAAAVAAD
jgi:thioesterase domain-containing protein